MTGGVRLTINLGPRILKIVVFEARKRLLHPHFGLGSNANVFYFFIFCLSLLPSPKWGWRSLLRSFLLLRSPSWFFSTIKSAAKFFSAPKNPKSCKPTSILYYHWYYYMCTGYGISINTYQTFMLETSSTLMKACKTLMITKKWLS